MIFKGDCREILGTLDGLVDAVVTDPPYGLSFMGADWDHGVPGVPFWEEILNVMKPGAHLLAFGGTRTYHRLMVAIEDAGFEIRDCLMWVYGQGFPKSLNVSKAIDKAAGAESTVPTAAHEWVGLGTAIKPSWEPIILVRKPLVGTVAANVLEHGTGALNIDICRVGKTVETWPSSRSGGGGYMVKHRGYKGDTEQTGAVPAGRWPANLIHDGSPEVLNLFPESKDGVVGKRSDGVGMFKTPGHEEWGGYGGKGSAARFFYCAKASKKERNSGLPDGEKNIHPTVKPQALMRYLIRLVTPPEGTVLDPFMGSGSTGIAAYAERMSFIGIEKDEQYFQIARKRLAENIDDLFL